MSSSVIDKVPFGLKNYWRMYKSKGMRLPIYYFFEAHLFDILHGTDTHIWLPKTYVKDKIDGLDNAVMYMASWTSEIKKVFRLLNKTLGSRFDQYTFIDIGCGKGKVGIVWEICCKKYATRQKIYGLELIDELVRVAKNNHLKITGREGEYYTQDALKISPKQFGDKFILYLFNPFDEDVLNQVVDKFQDAETIIVYNHPVHGDALLSKGFKILFETRGFHGNLHTIAYVNKLFQSKWGGKFTSDQA